MSKIKLSSLFILILVIALSLVGAIALHASPKKDNPPQSNCIKSKVCLQKMEVLSAEEEKVFVDIVGRYYDLFVDCFKTSFDGEDLDGKGARVSTGAVNGLYTFMEAIIMVAPGNRFWAAAIDGDDVRYFTNVDEDRKVLPKTINEWRNGFADKKIIYSEISPSPQSEPQNQSVSPLQTIQENPTTSSIPPGMSLIPAGCFNMGNSFDEGGRNDDDRPVHKVCFTQKLFMDVHEVTNEEYASCVTSKKCNEPYKSYRRTTEFNQEQIPYYGNPNYNNFPVVMVNWSEASAYCAWAGKRLPTEAEWEYAARGGLQGKRYPWGDSIACSNANFERYTHQSSCFNYKGGANDIQEVGSYPPNGFGLYDMSGNVSEWVKDEYDGEYYRSSPTNDPNGPESNNNNRFIRIYRGGSWSETRLSLRVSVRRGADGTSGDRSLGFRCARN